MITQEQFDALRTELSLKARNGIPFILAASAIWLLIAWIWTLAYRAYDRALLTFIASSFLLPLAWLLSRVFKTAWSIQGNPLDPLGLWLNFAQLFYFPILVFALLHDPDTFIMVYAIITAAHLFPYAWFYRTPYYAFGAGILSAGAMLLQLLTAAGQPHLIAFTMSAGLLVLALLLELDYRKRLRSQG